MANLIEVAQGIPKAPMFRPTVAPDGQALARPELMNTLEHGARWLNKPKSKVLVQGFEVEGAGQRIVNKQTLYLRSEPEHTTLVRIVQRLLTKAVARDY